MLQNAGQKHVSSDKYFKCQLATKLNEMTDK